MTSKIWAIVGGISLVIVIIAILIGVNMYVPKSKLENNFTPVPDFLKTDSGLVNIFKGLEKHGNVPVNIENNETGKTNPFE